MGSMPSSAGLTSASVNAPSAACSVSVPSKAMSVSAPPGVSMMTDTLSRTVPHDFMQRSPCPPLSLLGADIDDSEASADNLLRTAFVQQRKPMSYSVSTSQSLKQPQTSPTSASGYPQRLTTSTACHTVGRLSPRQYTSATSSRSPLVS